LDRLSEKKSDASKVLLASALKQTSSVRNAWLAERLGMGKPASASQFSQRFPLSRNGKTQLSSNCQESRPDVCFLLGLQAGSVVGGLAEAATGPPGPASAWRGSGQSLTPEHEPRDARSGGCGFELAILNQRYPKGVKPHFSHF